MMGECLFCGAECEMSIENERKYFNCPNCGRYTKSDNVAIRRLTDEDRARIASYFAEHKVDDNGFYIGNNESYERYINNKGTYPLITVLEMLNWNEKKDL